jgi:hypothetical protein
MLVVASYCSSLLPAVSVSVEVLTGAPVAQLTC